jgi:hypothetical protein
VSTQDVHGVDVEQLGPWCLRLRRLADKRLCAVLGDTHSDAYRLLVQGCLRAEGGLVLARLSVCISDMWMTKDEKGSYLKHVVHGGL